MTTPRKPEELFERPGILVVSRADYDGWPQGSPEKYVGPFKNWDEAQAWRTKEYGHSSGWHTSWQVLTPPEGHVIEEE